MKKGRAILVSLGTLLFVFVVALLTVVWMFRNPPAWYRARR